MEEILVFGASWCPDCRRAKRFLADQRVPYSWHDIEGDPGGVRVVQDRNDGKNIIPTIVFPDGVAPVGALERRAGGEARSAAAGDAARVRPDRRGWRPDRSDHLDLFARENLETLIIDSKGLGGQAGVTERLDNYPGFPEGIGGAELADPFVKQAERYGVEMLQAISVTRISADSGMTADGTRSTWRRRTATTTTHGRSSSPSGPPTAGRTPTGRTT